jgi:hypothetical protein
MNIVQHNLKSNGWFSIVKYPYDKKQHQNEQCGLDKYVDVLNEYTGRVNTVKLYENKSGLHFKADGSTHYLHEFVKDVIYVPFQVIEIHKNE